MHHHQGLPLRTASRGSRINAPACAPHFHETASSPRSLTGLIPGLSIPLGVGVGLNSDSLISENTCMSVLQCVSQWRCMVPGSSHSPSSRPPSASSLSWQLTVASETARNILSESESFHVSVDLCGCLPAPVERVRWCFGRNCWSCALSIWTCNSSSLILCSASAASASRWELNSFSICAKRAKSNTCTKRLPVSLL